MHKDTQLQLDRTHLEGECFLLFFYEKELSLSGSAKKIDALANGLLSACMKKDFSGEKGQTKSLYLNKEVKQVVLAGLGKRKDFKAEPAMDFVAEIMKGLRQNNVKTVNILVDTIKQKDGISILTHACSLGLHRLAGFKFKTKDRDKIKNIETITFMLDKLNATSIKQFEEASIVAQSVKNTRDLINTPANIATPQYVAEYAQKMAKEHHFKCTVFDERELKKRKMGCILAVGMGSASKPRMIILDYRKGKKKDKPLVLIGKGICFDTGGYNLKPSAYIGTMKMDKGGAITMIHVLEAIAKLKVKTNVTVIMAMAENMVSSTAYRPDDVITAYNGMTVEIGNTDAEGRLVMADALSYAAEMKPKAIVDAATLTGAATIAVGHFTTAIMSNDKSLIKRLEKASAKAYERVWELPIWDEYAEGIKSTIADVKNVTDGPDAGTIIAAMFLKNFIGESKWAHLDIANTEWAKAGKGIKQAGATGTCVRLLTEFVKEWK